VTDLACSRKLMLGEFQQSSRAAVIARPFIFIIFLLTSESGYASLSFRQKPPSSAEPHFLDFCRLKPVCPGRLRSAPCKGLAMLCLWILVVVQLLWLASVSKRQRRLDSLSLYDGLTGLLSGRVFERERWPAAIRSSSPVAFLYIDLDDLKALNKSKATRLGTNTFWTPRNA
jgi:predicted signal transduction protein with EAL and GGDEF domain